MTHEWRGLKNPATLLQSEFSTPNDLFLICQIELWSINRRVFETFGADIHSPAASRSVTEIHRLDEMYTAWYNNWKVALGIDSKQQQFLVDFCYHAGRLYLFSHVFRGQASAAKPDRSSRVAFDSALSLIQSITSCSEAGQWLHRLPSYFSTMIAFACVCLVRSSFQDGNRQSMQLDHVREEIHQLVVLFRGSEGQSHALASFADTLESAMGSQRNSTTNLDAAGLNMELPADFDWDSFWSESMNSDLLGNEMTWMFPLSGEF